MTQEDWVVAQLEQNGKITRNEALRHYVSRLGAIICTLKKKGYEFETKFIKPDNHHKDYEYKLIKISEAFYFATFGSGQLEGFSVNPMKVAVHMGCCSEGVLRGRLNKPPFNNRYCTTYPIERFAEMEDLWEMKMYSMEDLLKLKDIK